MDPGKLALVSLATLGTGIVLGLAADPQLRTFPQADWRARYRMAAPAAEPAPQPGVSYAGDGSTAWVFGGGPERFATQLPPLRIPTYNYAPAPDEPGPLRDDDIAAADAPGGAERVAAQAIVADALRRSAPIGDEGQVRDGEGLETGGTTGPTKSESQGDLQSERLPGPG